MISHLYMYVTVINAEFHYFFFSLFSCCINPIFFMISHLYMYVTVINMLSFNISLFNIFFDVFSYFLVIAIAL